MSLRVRAMLQDDIDFVYAIELAAHRAPWSRSILSDCVLVKYDCRVLEVDTNNGTEIAGYVISRYNDNICHILNLCISPTYQGKGYGQFLLQDVIDLLAKPNTRALLLEVRPSNASALHIYKKMGFEQIGIKKDYYHDTSDIEDAVVLEKKL